MQRSGLFCCGTETVHSVVKHYFSRISGFQVGFNGLAMRLKSATLILVDNTNIVSSNIHNQVVDQTKAWARFDHCSCCLKIHQTRMYSTPKLMYDAKEMCVPTGRLWWCDNNLSRHIVSQVEQLCFQENVRAKAGKTPKLSQSRWRVSFLWACPQSSLHRLCNQQTVHLVLPALANTRLHLRQVHQLGMLSTSQQDADTTCDNMYM